MSTSSTASTASNTIHSNVVPSEVGWQFVPQYYTFVNKQPNRLHCFYTKSSTFIHGTEGEDGKPCYGQQEIHNKITSIGFEDCKVFIHSVDAQSSANGGIIIQVIGEMSNKGEPWRKFVQTFFLAEQPNGYFVLNDIFRFLKEETVESDDASETAEQQTEPAPVPAVAPEPVSPHLQPAPPTFEPPREPTPPPAPAPVTPVPVAAPVSEEATAAETTTEPAQQAATPVPESPAPSAPAAQPNGIHPTEPTEKPTAPPPAEKAPAAQAPAPTSQPQQQTPAPTTPAAPATAPAPQQQQQAPASKPPAPTPAPAPQPKTWATLAAANPKGWGSAVATQSRGITETPSSPAPASGTQTPAVQQQQAAPAARGPGTSQGQQRGEHPALQAAQSVTSPHCFVKHVTESITQASLQTFLSQRFGPVKEVEIVRSKACAFLEFASVDSAKRAIIACLPQNQGGEGGLWVDGGESGNVRIQVETKKDRADRPVSRPRGGAPQVNGEGRTGGTGGSRGRGGGRGGRGTGQK